jgi:GNAT superfamily N-acetyltransferase
MRTRSLKVSDHATWLRLWRGYVDFYQARVSDEQTELTWDRLLDARHPLHGIVAQEAGDVVGFSHCFMHSSTWSDKGYCYLEDLFVDPLMRGRGIARSLIEATSEFAASQGAGKLYWLTAETNYTGRMLYDRVAKRSGFIHYERLIEHA